MKTMMQKCVDGSSASMSWDGGECRKFFEVGFFILIIHAMGSVAGVVVLLCLLSLYRFEGGFLSFSHVLGLETGCCTLLDFQLRHGSLYRYPLWLAILINPSNVDEFLFDESPRAREDACRVLDFRRSVRIVYRRATASRIKRI
jgi:hypothetical protein